MAKKNHDKTKQYKIPMGDYTICIEVLERNTNCIFLNVEFRLTDPRKINNKIPSDIENFMYIHLKRFAASLTKNSTLFTTFNICCVEVPETLGKNSFCSIEFTFYTHQPFMFSYKNKNMLPEINAVEEMAMTVCVFLDELIIKVKDKFFEKTLVLEN